MGLLRVLKDIILSDPEKNTADRNPPPEEHEWRDDGRSRGGMTKEQFFTELEKLTEVE